MQTNVGRQIAVIGAGIGGLTTALAFAQTGAEVTVFEQAAALTEVGAGLQITPNGARVLNALGLQQALTECGVTAQAVCPTDAISGRTITRFDLTTRNPAYRFYHRADLLGALVEACKACGVTITLNAHVTDIALDGSFCHADQKITPTLTVGADGLNSTIRPVLNGPADPFFTGQVAWRATIEADAPCEARIWMAPGRHVVTYPLRDGLLNIVAVQERSDWAAEGWHHPDDPANLQAAFADTAPTLQSILAQVTQTNLWGLYRHPVATHWYKNTIALIGDAAHPTLPFLAQGANLAIEDGLALAACCQHETSLDLALALYQTARRDRVVKAIDAANSNAKNYHLGGIPRRVAHTGLRVLGRVAPDAFLNRLGWLYAYDGSAIHQFSVQQMGKQRPEVE